MNTFGTVLIWLGIISVVWSIILGAFSNIKSHHPENEKDLEESLAAVKLYKIIFILATVTFILGVIFKMVW